MRSIQKYFIFIYCYNNNRQNSIGLIRGHCDPTYSTNEPIRQTYQNKKNMIWSLDLFMTLEEPYEVKISCMVLE